MNRNSSIVLFDGVDQPAVMGLFHKTLLLPNDSTELDDEQLRMIMIHELGHVWRCDIAVNWALVVIRAIHWWNPIYWLAAGRFRSLREQACDAFVIRRTENQPVRDYSELLLKLAARRPATRFWKVMLPASILSFFPSAFRNRAVRTRLKALRTAGIERGRWHTGLVAALILLAIIAGLTDANTQEPAPSRLYVEPLIRPIDLTKYEVHEVYDGPLVTRKYDLAKALDRIAADSTQKDDAKMLEQALNRLFPTASNPLTETASGNHADTPVSAPRRPTCKINGKTLTAEAPAALHDKIAQMLKAWEESGLTQFVAKIRFIRAKNDLVSRMGINWEYVEAIEAEQPRVLLAPRRDGMPIIRGGAKVEEYLPNAVAMLDENQVTALIDAAQSDRRANVLNAPTITFFNGQEATIADCTERPFVVGLRETSAGKQEPQIAVVAEGSRIKLHGMQSPDHKRVHLEANFNFSSIQDVAMASTMLRGKPATIQVPRVNRHVLDVASDIENGQTLLIGDPTDSKRDCLYLLLTISNVPVAAKAERK